VAIELGSGNAGDVGDVVVVSQGLIGKGFAAKSVIPLRGRWHMLWRETLQRRTRDRNAYLND
jgi:hypothetical protein